MSAITIENDLVHYEVLGRGRPVILVHGWLGSWRYWVPAMQQLSSKYRVYALDLWGFGDSGKDQKRYDFNSQVMLLEEFMEKMGITKAALIGHSLGAAVVTRYAAKHPDRVPRMLVVSPPLFKMAPPVQPLTSNPPPPERQLPTLPAELMPPLPAVKPDEVGATPTEADTMPMKSDEMKARVKAALERRVQDGTVQVASEGAMPVVPPLSSVPGSSANQPAAPKPPREAAVPPSFPSADTNTMALPEPLPSLPVMPKISYVPDPKEAQVQRANPLKEHLGTLDPFVMLEKHMDAGADLEKLRAEVTKADKKAVADNIESFAGVDTLRDLRNLAIPTVAVYGMNDTLLPAPDQEMIQMLREGRSTFNLIGMEDTRHFPMLENNAQFTRLLMDFLEVADITQLEIKKTWERRVR